MFVCLYLFGWLGQLKNTRFSAKSHGQTPIQTTQNPWFSAKKHGQTPTQTTQNIWFSTKSHGQPPTQTTHSAKSHFQNRKVTLRGYVTTRSRGTLVCTAQRLEAPPPGYAPTTHIRNISAELRRLNSAVSTTQKALCLGGAGSAFGPGLPRYNSPRGLWISGSTAHHRNRASTTGS